MRDILLKRWFLVILIACVVLAGLIPHQLRPLTDILNVRLSVALALFLMGWCLEGRSLWIALLKPWPALWAVMISYSIVPILGWACGFFLAFDDFRIGLIVITAVPCTLASAVLWTRMAGGNEATALWITLVTNGTSWLATSLWLTWATGTQGQIEFGSLMGSLLLVLVVPVSLGQLIRAFPRFAQFALHHKTRLGIASKFLILAIVVKAAVDLFDKLENGATSVNAISIFQVVIICLAIHLVSLAVGYWSSWICRIDRPNRIALAFGCSQKTLPVALFLYESYFQAYPLAVIPMAFYHVGQLVVDTFIAERMAAGNHDALDIPTGSEILT
jgi:sodium/bile acid cotransporter 7